MIGKYTLTHCLSIAGTQEEVSHKEIIEKFKEEEVNPSIESDFH